MEFRCMELAALGRPLYPGMLYNCCSDSFIPGVTLWNKQTITSNLDVHPQPKTDLKFSSSDTLSEKARLLDISGSLKASFLCGLVDVSGSAKYMNDTKSSEHQCRVTLQYSQTTKFEQMTMAELGHIIYPQVFEQQTATHVITGVQYGAQAFMVFDYTTSDETKNKEINGKVELLVKKIPILSVEGDVNLNLNDTENDVATNMSVTFYGDYELEENPTNFLEALQTYRKLPSLLRKMGNSGVPQRVWLYPLKFLDSKAAQLVREISASLVSKAELLLEELRQVERRCNDLLKNKMMDDFSALKERLQTFKTLQNNYKSELLKELYRVLPAIRGGTQEEETLSEILITHDKSPFTANNMNKWLDDVSTEVKVLSSYIRELKDIRVVKGSLGPILFDPCVDVVVCLCFTSLNDTDRYLEDLTTYRSSAQFSSAASFRPSQRWFMSVDIFSHMRQNLSLFASFLAANKEEERYRFIITSIPDPDNPGSSIHLYEKGRLMDPKFIPVSKPPPPTAEAKDGKVRLKLQKSPTGESIRFRVEYRRIERDGLEDDREDPWEHTDTSDAEPDFTLTGLQTGRQYVIRYRAISAAGLSEASESVCVLLTKVIQKHSFRITEEMQHLAESLLQPYPNWEDCLEFIPFSLIILGELIYFISQEEDISLNLNPPVYSYQFIRYPGSLKSCLMQLCNTGWRAFTEAHMNMIQIRLHTLTAPEYMSNAVKIMSQNPGELEPALLSEQLEKIRVIADEGLELADATVKCFMNVVSIIHEMLEGCVVVKLSYEENVDVERDKPAAEAQKRNDDRSEKTVNDLKTKKEMLTKVITSISKVKDHWCRNTYFFIVICELFKTQLTRTLKDFISTAAETKHLCYNLKNLNEELLYNQAFQATTTSNLVHMILSTYTELYSRHLITPLSSLGTLLTTDGRRAKHELFEFLTSCSEAERAIRHLIMENKKKFEHNANFRLEMIKKELEVSSSPAEEIQLPEEVIDWRWLDDDDELYG